MLVPVIVMSANHMTVIPILIFSNMKKQEWKYTFNLYNNPIHVTIWINNRCISLNSCRVIAMSCEYNIFFFHKTANPLKAKSIQFIQIRYIFISIYDPLLPANSLYSLAPILHLLFSFSTVTWTWIHEIKKKQSKTKQSIALNQTTKSKNRNVEVALLCIKRISNKNNFKRTAAATLQLACFVCKTTFLGL